MYRSEEMILESARKCDPRFIRDGILACLYAGALGDALGYAVEFISWDQIKRHYGKNGIRELELSGSKAVISDDTQMTLFTAEGLINRFFHAEEREQGASVEEDIYQAYLCWYRTQGGRAHSLWDSVSTLLNLPEMNELRAPGNTCLSALRSGEMGTIEEPLNHSKGCGGVMRTAPLGFLRSRASGKEMAGSALEAGARAAAITHGHPMGWIPGGMLSDIVDRCLYGNYGSLQEIIADSLEKTTETFGSCPGYPAFEDLIRRAVSLAAGNRQAGKEDAETDRAAIASLGEGWVGDEALAIAIYAALRWEDHMKNCLCAAVNHSGDSDSTGAIAGNILGAYLGLDAVPEDWIRKLELTDAMEEIADRMMQAIEL